MPNYDWTCKKCEKTFERFLTLAERERVKTVECECGGRAEQAFLSRRARVNKAYLEEVVYYENAKGEIFLAGDKNEPVPVGYERKSTGLLNEIRGLEKRLNAQDLAEFRKYQEPECEYWESVMKEAHSDMRSYMSQLSEAGKALAMEAMEYNAKTPGIHERRGDRIDFGYLKVLHD